MLRQRLAAAALIVAPLLVLFWLDSRHNFDIPGIWLVPLAVLLAGLLAAEFAQICRAADWAPHPHLSVCGAMLVVVATAAPYVLGSRLTKPSMLGTWGWTLLGLLLAGLAIFIREMVVFPSAGPAIGRLASTYFVVSYAGLSMSFLGVLRLGLPADDGLAAVFIVVAVTKLADTGAYAVGKTWGRRPLAPRLSPKKTVEGAVGGWATAVLTAWLLLGVARPWWLGASPSLHWPVPLAFGSAMFLAGLAGDLAESLIKRDVACKDSSRWLPGLGGVLDVLDSVLFAAPVGYLFWAAGWIR